MRITETETRLVLGDTPAATWVLGFVFVASGLFVLTIPFFAKEWATFRMWEQLAVLAIGLGHLGGGLVTAFTAAAAHTQLDRASGRGAQQIRRLWPRRSEPPINFSLADAVSVQILESADSDGDPIWQLRLWLRDSGRVWLTAQPSLRERVATEAAERVAKFLGLDAPTRGYADGYLPPRPRGSKHRDGRTAA
jgi:hypothetical protein